MKDKKENIIIVPEEFQEELEEDLQIDLMDLHEEWRRQSLLYNKYSTILSNIEKEKDRLKRVLDEKARKELLDKAGKVSEARVEAFIQSDEEYLELRYWGHLAIGAVKAIEQKKSALENEVILYKANYYSKPVESEEEKDESVLLKEKVQSDTRARIKRNLKRGGK